MNNHLFQALWFIVIFCLASVILHTSVQSIDMAVTKAPAFDKFYLGVACFSLSFLTTTALLQLYLQCRKMEKGARLLENHYNSMSREPLTKDWLNEIKPEQV